MATRDMAGFMGHHPDHLAGAGALLQQAGVKEHILPARDERVQRTVVNQENPNRRRIQPRRQEKWIAPLTDDMLDLGIADQGRAVRAGDGRHDAGACDANDDDQTKNDSGQAELSWVRFRVRSQS